MAEESHADAHDRGKLDRWWQDLSSEAEGHQPLHAVFLVSKDHVHAHNAFRRFRQAYEEASAPFHALTIFGQHGISAAERFLAQGFGVPEEEFPALVLFQSHQASRVILVPLGPEVDGELAVEIGVTLERFLKGGASEESLLASTAGKTVARECEVACGSIEDLLRNTMAQLAAAIEGD